MRPHRWLPALLALALVLTGCSAMLERDYTSITPHNAAPTTEGDPSTLRADSYQELVNALIYFVDNGVEEGTVRLYFDSEDVETDLEVACLEVVQEDPLGAYAVEFIKFRVTRVVTYAQADDYFTYRRTPELVDSIVLATGVTHRKLGLTGEDALIGAGVSYCAVCDGAFYQNRPVAVVGGGDTALQEALFLSARCARVTVIHRRDLFRGEQRLVQQLRERDNVDFLLSCRVEELLRDKEGLTGLRVRDLKTGEDRELASDGLFVAVGQEPRNQIFANLVMTDDRGYFLAGEDCATSLPGVFAAGDCRVKTVRQLTTAVGDGAVAGLAASAWADQHRRGPAQ